MQNVQCLDESRQRIQLSNGRYGSTSPTDRAQLNQGTATNQNSIGLSPIQQALPGFNIERVRYQKDLDAELRACSDIIMKLQQQKYEQVQVAPLSGKETT